ncbi:hypothetical protein EV421DRAFT_1667269, partial [Armillaria borealis]
NSTVSEDNGALSGDFFLVVDGAALTQVLCFDPESSKQLLLCDGVTCCRVSPLQKALIIRLVK